jgi:hypothetical protein
VVRPPIARSLACAALTCLLVVVATPAQAQPERAQPETVQRSEPSGNGGGPAVLSRIALGFVLATVGSASVVTAIVFWRAGGATMMSFGLLTFLYGASILITAAPIAPLFGVSRRTLLFASSIVTYLLPVPGLFYANRVRGEGWLSSLRWLWRVALALALIFIASDAVTGAPWGSLDAFRIFVIAAMIILLPHVLFWRQRDPVESTIRSIGTLVLALALVHDNLAGFGLLPWRLSLGNFGIGIFVLGLGLVTARSFFADQRNLAAVERELDTARSIQTSILPRAIPDVIGLDIAVRYLPARKVAGDVYDFHRVDERRLGMLVGDVAGHGVPAALIASMATVAFSSHPSRMDEPGEVLAEMNRVFCGHFDARFVTAACFFVDTERGTLRYGLAGHPWPLLWKARSATLESLTEGGLVLGLFPDASFPTSEVAFEPGDRLVVYTDGLTEAFDPSGAWFGDAELKAFIAAHRGAPAGPFADLLLDRVRSWTGRDTNSSSLEDDLTLAVIDRLE